MSACVRWMMIWETQITYTDPPIDLPLWSLATFISWCTSFVEAKRRRVAGAEGPCIADPVVETLCRYGRLAQLTSFHRSPAPVRLRCTCGSWFFHYSESYCAADCLVRRRSRAVYHGRVPLWRGPPAHALLNGGITEEMEKGATLALGGVV